MSYYGPPPNGNVNMGNAAGVGAAAWSVDVAAGGVVPVPIPRQWNPSFAMGVPASFPRQQKGHHQMKKQKGAAQQPKKKKVPKPQNPVIVANTLLKTVRRACDILSGETAEAAIAAFERAMQMGVTIDSLTANSFLTLLLNVNNLPAATRVLLQMAALGYTPLSCTQAAGLIVMIPQTTGVTAADCGIFVDAVVSCTQDLVHKEFFRKRARWAAVEFAEEALLSLTSIATSNPQNLARQGRCLYGCTIEGGAKVGEIICRGGEGAGPETRRSLCKSDTVAIQALGVSTMEMVEAEVINEVPLVLKVMDKKKLSVLKACQVSQYRIDQLANRVNFERAVNATRIISAPFVASKAKNIPSKMSSYGPAGAIQDSGQSQVDPVRPHENIIAALTASSGGAATGQAVNVAALCASPFISVRGVPGGFNPSSHFAMGPLNRSQLTALIAATSRRLTLVQGPPGTGKTATATRILEYWARSKVHGGREAVLACSDSNIAVDNLLEGLIRAGIKAVRLGRPESSRPDLLQYSADETAAQAARACSNPADAKKMAHETRAKVMREAQVVCATCVGAGSLVFEKSRFPAVLIDEASQATELATLIPLMRSCQQLVLVGDHCQLPPTIISEIAGNDGLDVSLFDRLVQEGVTPYLLDTQYRMHPAISEFPSDCFYGGNIADGITSADRLAPGGFEWPRRDWPVAFVNMKTSSEEDDGLSKCNKIEAEIVTGIAAGLISAGLSQNDIGIITPYAGQVRMLRRMLGQWRNLEISSVDGFQGREKAAIIVSTVRSNLGGAVGFLKDWRRANVALTRAKRGLIVVGNSDTLSNEHRSWRPWLNFVYAAGCVCNEPRAPAHVYNKEETRAMASAPGNYTFQGSSTAVPTSLRAAVATQPPVLPQHQIHTQQPIIQQQQSHAPQVHPVKQYQYVHNMIVNMSSQATAQHAVPTHSAVASGVATTEAGPTSRWEPAQTPVLIPPLPSAPAGGPTVPTKLSSAPAPAVSTQPPVPSIDKSSDIRMTTQPSAYDTASSKPSHHNGSSNSVDKSSTAQKQVPSIDKSSDTSINTKKSAHHSTSSKSSVQESSSISNSSTTQELVSSLDDVKISTKSSAHHSASSSKHSTSRKSSGQDNDRSRESSSAAVVHEHERYGYGDSSAASSSRQTNGDASRSHDSKRKRGRSDSTDDSASDRDSHRHHDKHKHEHEHSDRHHSSHHHTSHHRRSPSDSREGSRKDKRLKEDRTTKVSFGFKKSSRF